MSVNTIDEVIASLDAIIQQAWEQQSRIGYFAALYLRVTHAVRDGLNSGSFQNGPLMEHLDVVFASRYLDALATYQVEGAPSRSHTPESSARVEHREGWETVNLRAIEATRLDSWIGRRRRCSQT